MPHPSDAGRAPVLVAFAAPSGTGKTTLIEALIDRLRARGLRVGSVKSDAHRVELDTPGKDTHRMRASGAEVTGLVSRDQIAIFRDAPGPEYSLARIVEIFFGHLDVVVAEGFRSQGVPTVVLCRSGVSMEGWEWPREVVAVAGDGPAPRSLPRLDLDDPEAVARFLCEHFELSGVPR